MSTEHQQRTEIKHPTRATGIIAGLVSGLAMVAFTIAVRVLLNALTITELAADWFTSVLPPEVIDYLLESLSYSAKPLMFASLLVAQVLLGGLLGLALITVRTLGAVGRLPIWLWAPMLAVGLWAVSMVTLVPVFAGGFFGSSVPAGAAGFMLASLGAYVVYGASLGYLLSWNTRRGREAPNPATRRLVLRRLATWAIIGLVLGTGAKVLVDRLGARINTSGAFRTRGTLSKLVTPNYEFYVVSKNIFDTRVDVTGWQLRVQGLVEEPMALTYEQLVALPSVEEFITLECISNEVCGDLISNAKWKGVSLKAILDRARLKPGVVDVSFRAEDGYSESMSLGRALNGEVMVAYQMHGEPLSDSHGFPARLIVPGFFGLKSVKWLTEIAPVDRDFQGYWQQRGWTDHPMV
jgi:hypothetical protein